MRKVRTKAGLSVRDCQGLPRLASSELSSPFNRSSRADYSSTRLTCGKAVSEHALVDVRYFGLREVTR